MAQLIPYDDRDGYIWMDGELVPWREAKVHVLTHGLHYASCVFEGERAYGGRVLKLREHTQRLIDSGRILGFEKPYTLEQLEAATNEVVAKNGRRRPLRPPARLARARADGRLGAAEPDPRRDRGLAVGRLLQRPPADPRDLRPPGAQHRPGPRQGRRPLHDLHALASTRPRPRASATR